MSNEKKAIIRLKQGDIGGLEALVQLYQIPALRLAYLITCNTSQAEDVVQATFVQVYERINQFDESRPFKPWFMRCVSNAAIKAANQQSRFVSIDLQPESPAFYLESELEATLESQETSEELLQALAALSPNQRAAIVMHYYEGMSDGQIALHLDCPPGTIRRRLHDARQRLYSLLTPADSRTAKPGKTRTTSTVPGLRQNAAKSGKSGFEADLNLSTVNAVKKEAINE